MVLGKLKYQNMKAMNKNLRKYLGILAAVILVMIALSFFFRPHLSEVQYYDWPVDKDYNFSR